MEERCICSLLKGDKMKKVRALLLVIVLMGAINFCHGQEGGIQVFGGTGVTNQPGDGRMSLHMGAGISFIDPVKFGKSIPLGMMFELSFASPYKDFRSGSAVFSANYAGGFWVSKDYTPFFTVGYSRIFGTGNALNFGGGVDYMFANYAHVVRFEVRDYKRFSGAKENDVAFRVGYYIFFGGD
jgi:hypothetical protein